MYEEAEAILTKLPKPVEEDVDPPTESWSPWSLLCFLHSPGPATLQTRREHKTERILYIIMALRMGKHMTRLCCSKQSSIAEDGEEVVIIITFLLADRSWKQDVSISKQNLTRHAWWCCLKTFFFKGKWGSSLTKYRWVVNLEQHSMIHQHNAKGQVGSPGQRLMLCLNKKVRKNPINILSLSRGVFLWWNE